MASSSSGPASLPGVEAKELQSITLYRKLET